MKPTLTTLIYCIQGDQVLLAQRKSKPFQGMWVAPGGKIEPLESPRECALRELREETGLDAKELTLRGIVTEVSGRPDWQWMIFIYVTRDFSGELLGDPREGTLRWWPIHEVKPPAIPESDAIFFPRLLEPGPTVYEARYEYDMDLRLVRVNDKTP
ncbi:NUDIX hydrolase [Melittangium boletus]|uniref:NUDIX domain-containing protein n=1 Tax=Melittangium boletus DSM 14713 TaxID=1294270 RepID=A0A250ICV6_9BACT|nr:8-oxo-dGTP diphosphatase [Melittangium boletus]ATB29012.1 NUDIX domain-containing protein [Melittangium boletus DSM 14713]